MSNFRFGLDDYHLSYYPIDATDGLGGVEWEEVERVEIEGVVFVRERLQSGTRKVTRNLNCSNCGKRIGTVRNCEMYETCDGRQAWKSLDHEVCDVPNFCPNCGAKVVGE